MSSRVPRTVTGTIGAPLSRARKKPPRRNGPSAAVATPRPLRKDEERIAPRPHEPDGPGDALLPALGALPVDGDEADMAHGHPDDGDAQDGLLEDDPGHPGDEHHDQRAVDEAGVVGHVDAGRPAIEPLDARRFDGDAQDAPADPHDPQADGDERVPKPDQHAEKDDRREDDDHGDVEDDEERGSDQSGPDYSTAVVYTKRAPAGIMSRKCR